MSRIKVIPYPEANGRLKEIYDELIAKRGKLADVHMIQSLRPESIVKHMELYLEIMFSKSELTRSQREMMAVIVSVANQCSYCQIHHAEALNHYWKNEEKIKILKSDFNKLDLSARDKKLCQYADILTKYPEKAVETDITIPLSEAGCSDQAILDASLVVAYFNFVNRLVLALGVTIEHDGGKDFKY
ncbi:peroxidase-related enzyme [Ancylomarina longa]|uniref:Peroxidase n=1 Tax=Ancylomarina longa TaxID=2487017 RepID=A0A434AY09_9BACT|nr:peroxidase-related enzyme [Ancylomarina longa]RUT79404.1 peroxidase [Ancylomarina longa]